jgi:hypothetical protein
VLREHHDNDEYMLACYGRAKRYRAALWQCGGGHGFEPVNFTISDHQFPSHVTLLPEALPGEAGLKMTTELPDVVRELMHLYPQPRGRRPPLSTSPSHTPRAAIATACSTCRLGACALG